MNKRKAELINSIWLLLHENNDMERERDSIVRQYNDQTLFQAESDVMNIIASQTDINVTELAMILRKTTSACSQIIRKLSAKGWVEQHRDQHNHRIYHLRLTPEGDSVYKMFWEEETRLYEKNSALLAEFEESELDAFLRIMKCINRAHTEDIRDIRTAYARTTSCAIDKYVQSKRNQN